MKLYALGVPYTRISRDLLRLHSRAAVLEMLKLYGDAFAPHSLQRGTPYSRRVQREALAELAQCDLVSRDDKGTLTVNAIPPQKIVEVPTQLPWDALSLSELKVCLALYVEARHQRSPYFTWEGTHDELATLSRLNRKATGNALAGLVVKGIITMKSVRDDGSRWTRGTLVQLLDTRSGASLNDLAWFFRSRTNELDVLTRYRLALNPQFDFIHGFTADSGVMLTCPLCLNPKRTFRVTATETADQWHCFACQKSGDSAALCALRSFHLWKAPEFNLTELAAFLGADPNRASSMEGMQDACN
jgi:hypothetical protein